VRKPPSIEEAEKWVLEILSVAQKRVQEVEETLADVERYNQAIQQADAASKGLQNPELFARYERHINHTLKEALDRLAAIREQRNNGDFIGSFGQRAVED
jgi:RPA family protein